MKKTNESVKASLQIRSNDNKERPGMRDNMNDRKNEEQGRKRDDSTNNRKEDKRQRSGKQ